MWSGRGRGWWRRRRSLALAAGAALLCAAALCAARTARQARATHSADFPRLPPHELAHLLADFTNHPKLFPHLGSWTLEEEGGNYTHWWYSVSYECGARCAGRAAVRAGSAWPRAGPGGGAPGPGALSHGRAPAHRVLLSHRACSYLPLLSCLTLCEEWEIDSLITQLEEGGSRLLERWSARGWGAGGGAGGGGGAALADRARRRMLRLQAFLQMYFIEQHIK